MVQWLYMPFIAKKEKRTEFYDFMQSAIVREFYNGFDLLLNS